MSSWMLTIGLFLSSFTNLMGGNLGYGSGDKYYVGQIFFALAAFLGLVDRLLKRERILVSWPLILAAGLLLLCHVANIETNTSRDDADLVTLLIGTWFLPQLYLFLKITDVAELRFHVYSWTLGLVYGAAFTVAFCNGFFADHNDVFWYGNGRASGMTFHPNALGAFTVVGYPGLLLMFIEFRSWLIRGLVVVMAGLLWEAIGYSGSRTAVYTFVLMCAVIYVLMFNDIPKRDRYKLIVLPFLLVPVAVWVQSSGTDKYSALWRVVNGQKASDDVRAFIKNEAWTAFYDSPIFGAGFRWFRYCHNIFLEMLHSSGLVGFTGSMIALMLPLVLIYQYRWGPKARPWTFAQRCTASCLVAACSGVIISGLAQPNSTGFFLGIPFGLLLYFAGHRLIDSQTVNARSTTPRRTTDLGSVPRPLS